jgi:hypothetical protein
LSIRENRTPFKKHLIPFSAPESGKKWGKPGKSIEEVSSVKGFPYVKNDILLNQVA